MSVSIGSSYSQTFSFSADEINLNGGNLDDTITVSGAPADEVSINGGEGDNTLILTGASDWATSHFSDWYGLIGNDCTIPVTNIQNIVFAASNGSDTLTVGPYPFPSAITFDGIDGGNNELILQSGSSNNVFTANANSVSINGQSISFVLVPIIQIEAEGSGNTLTITGTTGDDSIYGFAVSSSMDALLLNNEAFEYSDVNQIGLYTNGGSDSFTTGYGSYNQKLWMTTRQ